jgi:hypothetical protein
MYGDSISCRFEYMPLDSMPYSVDSTFLCWRQLQVGTDSMNFNFMNRHGGGHHMMEFQRTIQCRLRWDTSLVDSLHRRWHPTGVWCWDGSNWISIQNVEFTGTTLAFSTPELYSAMVVVGEPPGVTQVGDTAVASSVLASDGNLPNPFSGLTEIRFTLSEPALVSVSIYDVGGMLVKTILKEYRGAGSHAALFDGSSLSEGVYFYRVQADADMVAGKAILVK